jgi:hypothetical protein
MQRSSFKSKRPLLQKARNWAADLFEAKRCETPRPAVKPGQGGFLFNPQPKENAVYHEGYRRIVASLPCIICGIEGRSQAAHPPPSAKGRKEDDRKTFPLCAPAPDHIGCHTLFDQYKLFTAEETRARAVLMGIETRYEVMTRGLWPKDLPYLVE